MKSGIGGVKVLSPPTSSNLSNSSLSIASLILSKLALCTSGLGLDGRLPLLIRWIDRILCRSDITWPAPGAAVTIVPGVAAGGGVGESVRNSGWMCASLLTLSVGL